MNIIVYFTLNVHSVGNAVEGYIINKAKMHNCVKNVLDKIFPVDLEIKDFDTNNIFDKMLLKDPKNNYYDLESLIEINDQDTQYFINWYVNEYNKETLLNIANHTFPMYLPCYVINSDIIPPKDIMQLKLG